MQPSSGQHQIVAQKAAGSCLKVAISAKDSCSLSSQQIALKQPSDGPQNLHRFRSFPDLVLPPNT